ncbi:hypothetical protein NOVOSPHI9U_370019 [Novosphingobium sp. 9U]|nr:hypothetical protein NOVOSPHI9U_370019 [Novosphingobium sp. 9U]
MWLLLKNNSGWLPVPTCHTELGAVSPYETNPSGSSIDADTANAANLAPSRRAQRETDHRRGAMRIKPQLTCLFRSL